MNNIVLIIILLVVSVFNKSKGIEPDNKVSQSFPAEKEKNFFPMSDDEFVKWKKTALPLNIALKILEHSEQMLLSELMTAEAAGLLHSNDLFVRAAAEWALSLRVGNENRTDLIVWPKDNNPEWFVQWYNIPLIQRIEMDWCRQAIAAGISEKPDKLMAQIEKMKVRIRLMEENGSFHDEDLADVKKAIIRLDELIGHMNLISQSGTHNGKVREYWLEARRILRSLVFTNSAIDFDSVVFYTRFAPHHKPNVCGVFHNGVYKPGGDITILNGLENANSIKKIIGKSLPKGHIHGMDLHFDGEKVVFGYGRQPEWPPERESHYNNISSWGTELRQSLEPVNLYEINTDGTGLKRLTGHPVWSDTEPVYCPNDDIAFSSERSAHSPSCDFEYNDIADVNLYLLQRKTNTIRRLVNNRDVDMTPRLLDNGLLAYLRWEYQERYFNEVHSIWTVRPDGMNPDALYKQHIPSPYALREVRSIPNSNKLVAIAAGHHCYSRGPIIVVDPGKGGNNPEGMEIMTPGVTPQEGSVNEKTLTVKYGGVEEARGFYRNPYPLSENVMLASYSYGSPFSNPYKNEIDGYDSQVEANGFGLYLIDSYGNKELIFRDPIYSSVDVFPLKKKKRPVILPDKVLPEKNYATCLITNIYEGVDNDVEPGSIKYIRISQHLPTPLDESGRARKFAFGHKFYKNLPGVTRWTAVREIGLVPVEEDGSAHFKVPTAGNASVYFQALDENYMELVRMRSSVSFQPGEVRSCTGCHETQNYKAPSLAIGLANKKPAVMPRKAPWGYEPFDYETVVQPVLDNKCISCHSDSNEKTNLNLTDKKITVEKSSEMFNQSYKSILGPDLLGESEESLVVLNDRFSDGSITRPRQFGSHKSKFIQTLLTGHYGVELTKDEWYALVTWVDYNAPYHGKLVNKYPKDGSPARREAYSWPDPWEKDLNTKPFIDNNELISASEDTTFLIDDPASEKVIRYDLAGNVKWMCNAQSCSDMHLLENGNILIADGNTVKEIDRSGRAILKFQNTNQIVSCEHLPNGYILAADSKSERLIVLDRKMKPVREIPLQITNKGEKCLRKVRVGPQGTYFVAQRADRIVGEYSEDGKQLRQIHFGSEVFCIVPMDNGNVILGGTGGIRIVDQKGNDVWSLKPGDIPDVNLHIVKDIVMFSNGNMLLLINEKDDIEEGLCLIEINRDKKVVKTFNHLKIKGIPSSVIVSGLYN